MINLLHAPTPLQDMTSEKRKFDQEESLTNVVDTVLRDEIKRVERMVLMNKLRVDRLLAIKMLGDEQLAESVVLGEKQQAERNKLEEKLLVDDQLAIEKLNNGWRLIILRR
jgi:hypothetical protein